MNGWVVSYGASLCADLTFLVIKTSEQAPKRLFVFHLRLSYCFWVFGDIHLPSFDYCKKLFSCCNLLMECGCCLSYYWCFSRKCRLLDS